LLAVEVVEFNTVLEVELVDIGALFLENSQVD
jgi:hypothetical protein